jgi:4-amino-4-deoxy-L-arabinose transferase-like glycosyltransferase
MSDNAKAIALFLVLMIQLLYLGLGARPIEKIQEARVAETARNMVESGDWIVPYFRGEIRLRKPPLAYWLTALSYKAFGNSDEFSARFASATFAGVMAIMLFFWAVKSLGPQSALRVVVCFFSSYIALRYLRSGATDAILLTFVVAACLVVYQILFSGPTLPRVLLLHLAMGLGFLTKGPAALAIPILVLAVFAVKNRQYALLRECLHPLGIAVLLLTALGWYGLIFYKMPSEAWFWITRELEVTYITGRDPNPVYWYLQHLLEFFFPWSLFIVPAAIWLYRTRPHPLPVQFALAWFSVTFVILSLNISKQMQYALLLTPPLMILVAHYLAASRERFGYVNRIIFIVLFAAVAVALPVLVVKAEGASMSVARSALLLAAGSFVPVAVARLLQFKTAIPVRELVLAGAVGSGWVYAQIHLYG